MDYDYIRYHHRRENCNSHRLMMVVAVWDYALSYGSSLMAHLTGTVVSFHRHFLLYFPQFHNFVLMERMKMLHHLLVHQYQSMSTDVLEFWLGCCCFDSFLMESGNDESGRKVMMERIREGSHSHRQRKQESILTRKTHNLLLLLLRLLPRPLQVACSCCCGNLMLEQVCRMVDLHKRILILNYLGNSKIVFLFLEDLIARSSTVIS